jgi:transposase
MKRRQPLSLAERERSLLLSWLESPALTKTMAQRVRIVLASADGHSVRATAERLALSPDTVFLWRRRFQMEGLDGLRSRKLPGRPRRIGRRREEAILAKAGKTSQRRNRPSAAEVARATGVSRTTVRRLWREHLVPPIAGGEALAPSPAVVTPGTHARFAWQPGAIVGIFLDRGFRLMVRIPPDEARPRRRTAVRARALEPTSALTGIDGPGTILTAFEAFSSRVQPKAREALAADALTSFLHRLARRWGGPGSPRLQVTGQPWRRTFDDAWSAVPETRAGGWQLRRPRTRGEWLGTVGGWLAGAPQAQARTLAGALGHLTDYFATWTETRGPFVWTDGPLDSTLALDARAGKTPRRGAGVFTVDRG